MSSWAGRGGECGGGGGGKNEGRAARGGKNKEGEDSTHLFNLANLLQPPQQLLIAQPRIPQHRTPTLQRFDNLVTLVARKREPRRVAVELHRSSEGLLGARGHAVGFVEDDELVTAEGEGHFFLGKGFDAVPDDVDTAVTRVERRSG